MSFAPKAVQYVATVVSTKMQKSCVVVVEKAKWNSHIKKNLVVRERKIVDDKNSIAELGDKVLIESAGRKLSANKSFFIKEVVKKASLETEFYNHLHGVPPASTVPTVPK